MADNILIIEVEIEGKKGFAKLESEAIKAGQAVGKDLAETTVESFSSRMLSLKGLIVGALTGALASFARSAVAASQESEVAVRSLETSLLRVGALTSENTKFFLDQASTLQILTKVTDEQALSFFALANNYARSRDEAVRLVKASMDLASATGISVESAIETLGRSLNGVGRGLNTLIPGFRTTTEEALKSGAALDFVASKFGGDAEAKYVGFIALQSKIAKSFDEMLEAIGRVITESSLIQSIGSGLASAFNSIRIGVEFVAANFDELATRALRLSTIFASLLVVMNARAIFTSFSDSIAEIAVSFIKTAQETGKLGPALKAAFFSGELAAKAFTIAINLSKAALTLGLTLAIDYLVTKFIELRDQGVGVVDALKVIFIDLGSIVLTVVGSLLTGVQALVSSIPGGLGEALSAGLDTGIVKIADAKFALDQMSGSIVNQAAVTRDLALATDEATNALDRYKQSAAESPKPLSAMEEASKKVAETFKSALVSGISNGIQTIVKSMTSGKFSFDQFGKILLGIIGNIAIQIGTTLVSIGIAVDSLKASLLTFTGGPAIAAGIALIAIGALLSSLASGGADTPNVQPGGGLGTGGAGGGLATTPTEIPVERVERKTEVVINVQGNVLDRRESGLEIANVLQEYFDTNNGVLART